MRIYIDSADNQTIEQALVTGYVYGMTTNSTLLQRANVRAAQVAAFAKHALGLGAREIHLQVYSVETSQMLREAASLTEIDPARVVVKIPATAAEVEAMGELGVAAVTLPLAVLQQLPESAQTAAAVAAFTEAAKAVR